MGADKNPSLKLLRKSRGKTLVGLSIELGYSATFLNQIERGMSTITEEVARVLTNYYKVPIYPTQVPHRVEINRLNNENEALEKQIDELYDTIDYLEDFIVRLYKMNEAYRNLMEKLYTNSFKVKERADNIAFEIGINDIEDYLIDHQLLVKKEE